MPKNLKLLIAALLLVAGTTTADADEGTMTVLGLGMDTCSTWLTNRSANPNLAVVEEEFMFGFLTGIEDMYGLDHHATTVFDKPNLEGWLINFCTGHPNKLLVHAAGSYWLYSDGVRVTPDAPPDRSP